jgi:hypothetical protein
VLTFGNDDAPQAVISSVIAQASSPQHLCERRLSFAGPVEVDDDAMRHLIATVVPLCDAITDDLHCPRANFQVSIVNIRATGATDLRLQADGFSLDLPLFMSLLSAAMALPLRQDVLTTGHLASLTGDIRPVRHLPDKLAAVRDPNIVHFICPEMDTDWSRASLAPGERERAHRAVIDARTHCTVTSVVSVSQVVPHIVWERDLVLASLRQSFFEPAGSEQTAGFGAQQILRFLTSDNESRFWSALQNDLHDGRAADATELLSARIEYQLSKRHYPRTFGSRLAHLVHSLPSTLRRLKQLTPPVTLGQCIALAQFAGVNDYADCQVLFGLMSEQSCGAVGAGEQQGSQGVQAMDHGAAAVETVLQEISAGNLARTIGVPIDGARASFPLVTVILSDADAFYATITAFYIHLLRCVRAQPATPTRQAAEEEAVQLVTHAFSHEVITADDSPVRGALAEARTGLRGGMRFVLDAITEQFKVEQKGKHVAGVLERAVDPQDPDEQVAFVKALLAKLGPHLLPEFADQPPERYARHYVTLAAAYVRSLDSVSQTLRSL